MPNDYLRSRVLRPDGKLINVVHKRGHLMVCATGCCCGHTERGHAPVPTDLYHREWEQRKLRNNVHLTQGGCLGPCPLANVVLLTFDGRPIWLYSINSERQILAIFDYVDAMLEADSYLPPPADLEDFIFDYYTWSHTGDGIADTGESSSKQPAARAVVGGDILFLTHADTDLLTLAHTLDDLPDDFPTVDAENLLSIKSEAHMERLIAQRAASARVILMRVWGRPSSVPGFHKLAAQARENDQHLVIVSGTGDLDPDLTTTATVSPAVVHEAKAYLDAGGRANLNNVLRFLSDHFLMTGFGYEPPVELPEHGIYHPDLPEPASRDDWLAHRDAGRPTVGVVFYRSHWLAGNTAFVDALVQKLDAQGANALPIFTASLRTTEDCRLRNTQYAIRSIPERWPAAFNLLIDDAGTALVDVLITAVSFAMGHVNPDGPTQSDWSVDAFDVLDVPVLQAVTGSTPTWKWEVSPRGLNPLDTAMNVAMPEFDGRITTVPISFKEPLQTIDASPGGVRVDGHCTGLRSSPVRRTNDDGRKTQDAIPTDTDCCENIDYDLPSAVGCLPFDVVHYQPLPDRVRRLAGIALRLAALGRTPNADKRVAFVLTNAPSKASQIGNAVGLDAPASLMRIFDAMREAGYRLENVPAGSDTLIHTLIDRCSYDETMLTTEQLANAAGRVPVDQYQEWFEELPESQQARMRQQWGEPPGDAYVHDGHMALAGLDLGNAFVALQPPRGHGMDPDAIYHQPDLPPPHNYYALYRWLRDEWGADAIVHVGKHGTLEWLPGKGVGLSRDCFPDSFLGDLPLFYPFILNDPGEGMQAKRRAHSVIVDHLVPPMTTADLYDELAQLMQLVDEYYQVELLDPSKLPLLQEQIWDLIQEANLQEDLKYLLSQDHGDHTHEWDETLTAEGTPVTLAEMDGREVAHLVEDIDGYLCDLAGAQIRDGLHVLGQVPEGEQMVGLLQSLTRLPNMDVPSLRASVAELFDLDLDTLLDERGRQLDGLPDVLAQLADRPLVTAGDALETIDELCHHLLALLQQHEFDGDAIETVIGETFAGIGNWELGAGSRELDNVSSNPQSLNPKPQIPAVEFVCERLVPTLHRTSDEITNLLRALDGGYVPAGPSGAPTRGMAHVLPTGRNFYAVDPRTLPSVAAWRVGKELAREVLDRYLRETGEYPESVGISAWGTSAMRTHGDDVAEILALMGVRPVWQKENRRLTGIEVIPLEELDRPRIDVTVRISGFFRDAFPHLIELLDEAVEMVVQRNEPLDRNFVRKHYLDDLAATMAAGLTQEEAERQARYRIFGSKPGTYGAGILPLIDERNWHDDADFAEAYVNWGGYAYTAEEQGTDARDVFRRRLSGVQVALHNQDNREHDIFDSDDYLQFHGGMIASIRALTGRQPRHYFGDTSNPERPAVRDLKEEALRVFRSRVVNPKWLESIRRHGYKGGVELTATVDYLFGYDATAGVVDDWMYDDVAQAYALDAEMQDFFAESNPWALQAISERLLEAAERGLWEAPNEETLDALRDTYLQAEAMLEGRNEPALANPRK